MSETDPWKVAKSTIRARIADYSVALLGHSSGSQQAKENAQTAIDVAIDAARAAEAAQHQQEIERLARINAENARRLLVRDDEIAAQDDELVMLRKGLKEACRQNVELRAERDKQAEQIADLTMHKASRDSQLGCLLEDIGGKKYPTMNEARDQIAAWKAMTAERDRLKAALEAAQPFVVDTYRRGGRVGLSNAGDVIEQVAAALTPQGQSTDGETK